MKYQLGRLDEMVTGILHAKKGLALTDLEATGIAQEALEETAAIREQMVEKVFSFKRPREIELYVKNFQSGLTLLLDKLYAEQQKPIPNTYSWLSSLYKPILDLLSFIEEKFSSYFDRSEAVPAIYLLLTRAALNKQLTIVKDELNGFDSDDALVTLLLQHITSFLTPIHDRPVNYHEIMFYKHLFGELQDAGDWRGLKGPFPALHQLLIYINFNDRHYINYTVNWLQTQLNQLDDINEKMDAVLTYSKVLAQLQRKPDTALRVKHPPVALQLGNWLNEELAYWEKKRTLLRLTNGQQNGASRHPKIKINSSVDQVSILLRAAVDANLIHTDSQKALFDRVAPFISTTHSHMVSAGSLRSKSYTPEQRDLDKVKDLLMDLFKRVTKY